MRVPQKKTEGLAPQASDLSHEKRDDYSANERLTLTVPAACAGLRLDQALAQLRPQHSRSRLQNWIREGRVSVGGVAVCEPKHKLWGGETIDLIEGPDEHAESSAPEDIALDIVFEDEALIVIDKPAGLVVHPGNGNRHGTLLNALLFHAPALKNIPRAGIVHRLDKDTTGLMVVAKTLEAQTNLVRQLQARTVKRYYQALVRGNLERGGSVDAPIGRHPTQRTRMAVVRTGKPARTHYRIVERFLDCTLVECALETGRTHQIRVHMAHIGHPLVGDPVYGGGASRVPRGPEFHRQALHARKLGLIHPITAKSMQWRSELPDDMSELIEVARSLAFEARLAAEAAAEEWEDEFEDGPEIIYAYGDEGAQADDTDDIDDEDDVE
ncbi:23S rRNA pseudouridine(1911/1915/1917) synthase RluD [Propionivibrio soli]|uniref:23S rRNA pseudouridine(1911/1915/1917) synthase RluD n=1 Tax=Propionivibrio soli TaxID=2976531 RepID=UPI003B846DEB